MILPVRPSFLFDQVKEDRIVTMPFPARQSGSPSLLETFVLLAAGKIVKPKRIFEIGTFTGQTAFALNENFPDAEIFTLDLDPDHSDELLKGYPEVKRLQGHSMQFNFAHWYGTCDLVFIDGGHDYETVKADTGTASRLLRPAGAIVWHDFANPAYPGVKRYLEESGLPVFHVEDTQMAVYFSQNCVTPEFPCAQKSDAPSGTVPIHDRAAGKAGSGPTHTAESQSLDRP